MSDSPPTQRTGPARRTRSFGAGPIMLLLAFGMTGLTWQARAQGIYALDQRFGSIEFTVENVGIFTSSGTFQRFHSDMTIDEAHPERTRIAVDVDAGSVDMFWEDGITMLRSPQYFDVQRYPDVHFKSVAVEAVSPDHYVIRGELQIKGISQPCVLDARMLARHMDADRHAEIADFVVTGALKRSDFGMTADENFVSDTVKLKITAHIQLPPVVRAN